MKANNTVNLILPVGPVVSVEATTINEQALCQKLLKQSILSYTQASFQIEDDSLSSATATISTSIQKGDKSSLAHDAADSVHPTRHQSFHINPFLMNKPVLLGSKVMSSMRALVAFAIIFLAVGVGQSFAQADVLSGTTLSGSAAASTTKTTTQSSNAVFVSNLDALRTLKLEVDRLQNTSASTAAAEAELAITADYYTSLVNGLSNGGSIGDLYNGSFLTLAEASERYNSSVRPDLTNIRQNLLTLVTQ